MTPENQHRAFISYSRANKEFAVKLTKGLKSAGYPVWFDQLDIPTGSRWDDEVEKALRECPIFMIILTPASIASDNVKDEIGYAIDHGKRILPILLEDCDVPLRLRRFQYVDFTTKSFEEGFESAKELLDNYIKESKPIETTAPVTEEQKTESDRPVKVMPAEKKSISMGLIVGVIAVVGVIALIIAGIGLGALSRKNISGETAQVINGFNVYRVEYQGADYVGEFVMTGDKAWVEQNSTYNSKNPFVEINRDEWSVYLYNSERKVNIKLDLHQKQIYFNANDGKGEIVLYPILNAEANP